MRFFRVSITDRDGEYQSYSFKAHNLWEVTMYIQLEMGLEGDFYGHKANDTCTLHMNEMVEVKGHIIDLTELGVRDDK